MSANGTGGPPAGALPLDTSSRGPSIAAEFVVMFVLATITVAARIYTRVGLLTGLKTEDWLVIAGLVFSLGTTIGFVRQTSLALGSHIWTVSPEDLRQNLMEQWYSFVLYMLSLTCTKMSILVLYTHILQHGVMRIANFALVGLVAATSLWAVISSFITCIPLQTLWDPNVPGNCLSIAEIGKANSILHIVTDFAIFMLPLPIIVPLKMHWKQKVGLLFVFVLGFVVCLISIARLVSVARMDFSNDPTYDLAILAYWGAVEVNLAIICACLATLKPLFHKLFPKLLGPGYGVSTAYGTAASRGRQGATALRSTEHRGRTDVQMSISKPREVDEGSAISDEGGRSPAFPMDDLEAQPVTAYKRQGL